MSDPVSAPKSRRSASAARPATAPRANPPRANPPRAWQRMLSGRRLDLLDPSPVDVEIEDIAHGLARVARWNGQTSGPNIFSVAQHSLLVEHLAGQIEPALTPRQRLMILLHDAPEYVIGDMISPFKAAMGGDYKAVEARLSAAIHLRFGLPPAATALLARITKQADRAAAYLEATHLAGFSHAEADSLFGRPGLPLRRIESWLRPLSAEEAKQAFLARFHQLDERVA